MSVEAISWALKQPVKQSSAKFVLVAIANCADGQDFIAWPSMAYLVEATGQDRKTVQANMNRLREMGYLEDTEERKGATKQVVVYRLKSPENGPVHPSDEAMASAVNYLYRVTDPATGQFYVGVRSCFWAPEADTQYRGSGRWPESCAFLGVVLEKEILSIHSTRKKAEQAEAQLIAELLANPLCMNSPKTGPVGSKMPKNGAVQRGPNSDIKRPNFPHKEAQISHETGPKTGHGTVKEPSRNRKGTVNTTASRKTRLPENFGISDRVRAWAADKGHSSLEAHLEYFAGWARSKGATYVDWDEALMTAIRSNWAKVPTAPNSKPGASRHGNFASQDYRAGVAADGSF